MQKSATREAYGLALAEFGEKYDINIYKTLDEMLDTNPDFVVSCVNKAGMCDQIELLCQKGVAVLSETPVGDCDEQADLFLSKVKPEWRVQVAEQFHLQPLHQAIKAVIDQGVIGEVSHVHLSCCHDYHAVSLIRTFLGVEDVIPAVKSVEFNQPLTIYNGRGGVMDKPFEKESTHTLSFMDFGGKTALYDFVKEQYFSDIRRTRIAIQGTKGEIVDGVCTYLEGNIPCRFELDSIRRGAEGNLDGMYLDCITAKGNMLYKNPFGKARLTDEEFAIATCLVKMDEYLKTGKEFYSVGKAAVDAKTAFLFH